LRKAISSVRQILLELSELSLLLLLPPAGWRGGGREQKRENIYFTPWHLAGAGGTAQCQVGRTGIEKHLRCPFCPTPSTSYTSPHQPAPSGVPVFCTQVRLARLALAGTAQRQPCTRVPRMRSTLCSSRAPPGVAQKSETHTACCSGTGRRVSHPHLDVAS
jgi:hypothetical protein